jgi:hypothetical protein
MSDLLAALNSKINNDTSECSLPSAFLKTSYNKGYILLERTMCGKFL